MLLILGAVSVSFIVAEFSVRFAQPELNPQSQIRFLSKTADRPVLGPPNGVFRQTKNTGDYNVQVRFNAVGFRDSRSVATAAPEDFLLVGDSFTFGWGVREEDRISEQLERLIKQRVFNVSIPVNFDGYERLLNYAKQLGAQSRRVIIVVSMETDLQLYDGNTQEENAAKEVRPRGAWLIPLKSFLTQHLALYSLATTLVHRVQIFRSLAARFGVLIPNLEGLRKYEFSHSVIESSARRLARLAEQYQSTIVVIPSRALWHGNYQETEDRRHKAFIKRLNELGLSALDLRQEFEKINNPLSLHFEHDPHWRPEGHKIAAEKLFEYLRQRYSDI